MGQRVDLVVISTSPSGPVIVNDTTKITVSEESAKNAGDKRRWGSIYYL